MDIQRSGHPIISAWIIVNCSSVKVNVIRAKSSCGLSKNCLLADANSLIYPKPMPVTPMVLAIAIVGAVPIF